MQLTAKALLVGCTLLVLPPFACSGEDTRGGASEEQDQDGGELSQTGGAPATDAEANPDAGGQPDGGAEATGGFAGASGASGSSGSGAASGDAGIVGGASGASGDASIGGTGGAVGGSTGSGGSGGIPSGGSSGTGPGGSGGNELDSGIDPDGSVDAGSDAALDSGGDVDASAQTGTIYLSDVCEVASDNGWGPVERDLSNGEEESGDGGPIIINGHAFSKGLGMHAPAEITYDLAGACSTFQAEVGIDEEMKGAGSVIFQVWGDGDLLDESASLGGWQGPASMEVDISGVQSLRLVVDDDGGNGSDHADWGDARVACDDLAVQDCSPALPDIPAVAGHHLVWSDEFDVDGTPNPNNWGYESGMVRNNEWQYYTDQNATVVGGFLIIQGRREPHQGADYTSSSLRTINDNWTPKQSFTYGRFEIRARIVAEAGLWPAFWTLGVGGGNWPFNGEIDIMEYYNDRVHANVASSASTDQNAYDAKWDGSDRLVSDFGIADWDAKFHVWRMDWDSTNIVLSIDDYVMNDVPIANMHNADGTNPFDDPHYILVNLAIGGDAGGDASNTHFPTHYVVDYVRVYQRD